jgi:hypothetical protein
MSEYREFDPEWDSEEADEMFAEAMKRCNMRVFEVTNWNAPDGSDDEFYKYYFVAENMHELVKRLADENTLEETRSIIDLNMFVEG